MNRVKQNVLVISGAAMLLCSLLPWFVAHAVILGAGGGEWHGILATDQPRSYDLLEFESWQQGPGDCTRSHIRDFSDDYRILAHRVGRAEGTFTRFTYYEARYLTPDGDERITHAAGPEPLLAPRYPILWGMTLACLSGAFLLFRGAWKLSREESQQYGDLSEPMDLRHLGHS